MREFREAGKPILNCRGMQLIKVAFGGSLIQDIPALLPAAIAHETPHDDRHRHEVTLANSSWLQH